MLEVAAGCGIWLLPGGVVALWLAGFGGLLLLGVTPFRYATGGALRVFSLAVAVHALLCLLAIRIVADASAQRQNPSDAVSAAGAALVASGLVALGSCWLGRSWTPRPRTSPEPPAAIDWSRGEGRRAIIGLLWMIVLVIVLVLSAPVWGLALVLLLLLSSAEPLSWSAGSLGIGFLLAAVVALAVYVWLSTGKRGAQRAPLRPTAALPLGVLFSLIAISLPRLPRFAEPELAFAHDRALFQLLRDSAAKDAPDSFERAQRELLRRPSDRAHSEQAVSRELRHTSSGSGSMSAQLAAHERPPPPSVGTCMNFLGDMRSPSLSDLGPPELAVIDVLLARGATQEVWAWMTDSEVPLNLRFQLVERRSLQQTFPRARLIAAFGKTCVEAQKRETRERAYAEADSCRSAIERLLPREPRALTVEEGFAAAYAAVAIGQSSVVEHVLARVSGDVAVAILTGMHAAEASDASRRLPGNRGLECSTLAYLTALICPADRVPVCPASGWSDGHHTFSVLEPCIAQLPPPSPALLRLGGY